MGDIKLFRYGPDNSMELVPHFAQMERNLQFLMEKHLETFLGIRLLAHEYHVGRRYRGSIDTLGIDENNCPVIIEYKRFNDENVICQGLYYLNWLMNHQGEFYMLAHSRLEDSLEGKIEFSGSRILCIASSFSRYDEDAIMQIDRNIELIRYRFFGEDMLMLELLNTALGALSTARAPQNETGTGEIGMPASLQERVRSMNPEIETLYLELLSHIENMGQDINIRFMKHYIALSRFRNFLCIQPTKTYLKLWLNLDPATITLEDGFSRDVSNVGHHASGRLQIDVRDPQTFLKAQPFIEMAYEAN